MRFWDHWNTLAQQLEIPPLMARKELYTLLALYSEKHRAYHNLAHIEHCLDMLEEHIGLAENLSALQFAFIFHDAIYHSYPRPGNLPSSEALSAAYADDVLRQVGMDIGFRTRVAGLIMVTLHKPHHLPGSATTPDEMLMADIDWSPLGWSWDEYMANKAKVRIEYGSYDDAQFASGRIAFLQSVAARHKQFYLPAFVKRFGAQAIENVTRELAEYGH